MRLRKFHGALFGSFFCIQCTTVSAQTVWYVNDDASGANTGTSWTDAYTNLHSALAAAQNRDQIWVASGRYVGNFTLTLGVKLYGGFAGTETQLTQRNWSANPTILDGNQNGSVVMSPSGATATTRIDGFTITNGTGTVVNTYYTYGGGLYLYNSSPTIVNNTITGNIVSYEGSSGGGLSLYDSSPTIANNMIAGNSAGSYGGGLYLSGGSPRIVNSTITGNSAHESGGLSLHGSSPAIANTIVAFNSSGIYKSGGTPALRHNCVYGNGAYDYSGLTDPTGTDGNISADPRLADPGYGNTHIQPDSPCVDAGSNADAFGNFDVDGQPRVQPLSRRVDIGADESDATVWPAGPYVIVRVSPAGNDANDGSSWALAKRTVQAGIDAAAALGGEVWVQSGTYGERITLHLYAHVYGGFSGTETKRDERDWRENVTTLDGEQQGSVVTARAGYGAVSAIDGFTITNGTGTASGPYGDTYGGGFFVEYSSPTVANNKITGNNADDGGGLYIDSSSPTIANNTITGNTTSSSGGGIALRYSSPTIANNTITSNSAYYGGGGLYLYSSSPTIANNTITGNTTSSGGGGLVLYSSSPTIANNTITANSAYYGGGLYMDESSPTIANNTITGNRATGFVSPYGGGGLYLDVSSPTIANNTITNNIANDDGGGLYLYSSSPMIVNNTITGNSARWDSGALYLAGGTPTIANNIIAFNSSGINDARTSTLRNNCVYGNSAYDDLGRTNSTGTNGNIYADPRLADPKYGNMHIQPDSPCVDAGNNADAYGNFDVDGQARVQPTGGTVDIGADESDDTMWPVGPYIVVRVSPQGDDANDGSSWALAKRTVQAGINAASALGGDVWVQGGTYEERIVLHAYAYVYGGFAGGETRRDERNWGTNPTILESRQQGDVVTVRAGHRISAIDGFTITHARSLNGSGVTLANSSPTIANNTITGNTVTTTGYVYGGGLNLSNSSATITNNTITGNSASGGGGLVVSGGSPTIANNTITGNIASRYPGGGLYLENSSATIANNTITGNSAWRGGGLHLVTDSPYYMTIANTIIAFNSSGIYKTGNITPTLRNNCVYGNSVYDYSGLTDPTGTNGNISADPIFVQNPNPGPDGLWGTVDDDLGDLQLLSGSACIDAGANWGVPADTLDLDGDGDTTEPLPLDLSGWPRFMNDPLTTDTGSGTPPIVDMGAYEYRVEVLGDCRPNGRLDLADFASLADCIVGPASDAAAECDCADMNLDGDVDLRDSAAFQIGFGAP